MKKFYPYYIFLFGALLIGNCKAQQTVPAIVEWDYVYQTVAGTPMDSLDVEFDIYYSTDSLGVYLVAGSTQEHTFNLLNNENIYNDQVHYFYLRARRLSTGGVSGRSTIVSALMPVIEPNVPINATIIYIGG